MITSWTSAGNRIDGRIIDDVRTHLVAFKAMLCRPVLAHRNHEPRLHSPLRASSHLLRLPARRWIFAHMTVATHVQDARAPYGHMSSWLCCGATVGLDFVVCHESTTTCLICMPAALRRGCRKEVGSKQAGSHFFPSTSCGTFDISKGSDL